MKNLEGKETKHGPIKAAPKPPMHPPKAVAPSPNSRKLLQGQRPEKPELPAGWLAYWSAQYQMYYYYNPSTGNTQWEKPTMPTSNTPAPAPAPAPVPAPSPTPTPAGGHGSHSPSPAPPPAAGGGHGPAAGGDHVEKPAGIIDVILFEFGDEKWKHCEQSDLACFRRSASDEELLGRYEIQDDEQAILMEFEIKDDSTDQYFVVISDNPEPMAIAIAMHSLGWSGKYQVIS
jgi:hypothetical protein